jgi:hypothetical protein
VAEKVFAWDFSMIIDQIKAKTNARIMFQRFWPGNYRERGNCRCPWHEDSTESLQLDDDFAFCHACALRLDAIDLYCKATQTETSKAIESLAVELGINNGKQKKPTNPKHKPSIEFIKRWNKIAKNDFNNEALEYIEKKRALPGMVQELHALELIACDPKFKAWNHTKESYDRWNVVAFPLTNAGKTEMLGIQYVSTGGLGKKFASGTNGKDAFFFHGSGNDFMVVTGAVIDALSVYVACKSKHDLTVCSILSEGKGYAGKLAELSHPSPVLFFDNDEAGRNMTRISSMLLKGNCRLVDWSLSPEGMKDVNDLLKAGHSDIIETMVRSSRIPSAEEIQASLESDSLLQARLTELNLQYSVVMLGGKCLVMRQVKDPIFGRKDITFSSFNDFKNFHSNEKYWLENGNGKAKKKIITDIWIEQPTRTQFNGIVFNPTGGVDGYYNLWHGFAYEPRKGSCNRLLEHIRDNIAMGNSKIYQYVLAWMAEIVQNPGGKRPGVSLVLRGKQGVGKGCLAEYFGKILGNHFLHITQASQLTGKFNNHLKDALLVFADEAFWAGDKNSEGVLKGMITEDIIMIEPKGRDPFSVKNHVRLMIASNNDWLVPAGPQERRFCVLDVSEKHQQDHAYFAAIEKEMKSGGREALLHLLLEADLSNFDFYNFPRTEALLDQKISSMGSSGKFWFECLRRGSKRIPTHSHAEENQSYFEQELPWELQISTQELYQLYISDCKNRNDRYPCIDSFFGRKIRDLCPDMRRKRASGSGDRFWIYQFPALDKCRNLFNDVMKTEVKWEEDG